MEELTKMENLTKKCESGENYSHGFGFGKYSAKGTPRKVAILTKMANLEMSKTCQQ